MPRQSQPLFEITQDDRETAEKQLREQQRTVDFDTKEFTVELLVHKYKEGDLEIPGYQREFVWSDQKQSKFIESLLLGLPIPYLFGADQPETGKIEIVDGVQRLRTVARFLDGKLELGPLEKLNFLSGYKFSDLSIMQQRRLKNRTMRMVALSAKTDQTTRFDVFERINTGSLNLAPSELRKGAFSGKFYDFVHQCARDAGFAEMCPVTEAMKRRGEPEELVLRFFAYAERYTAFRHDVARFLNEYLIDKNESFDREAKEKQFHDVLRFVKSYFPCGFVKSKKNRATPRVRFEAISIGVHLALQEKPRLRPQSMDWLDSEEFKLQTTTHASNSAPRLAKRIEFVRDSLLGT